MLTDLELLLKNGVFCRVRNSSNVDDNLILVGMDEHWSKSVYVLHIMKDMGSAPIRGDSTLYPNKYYLKCIA